MVKEVREENCSEEFMDAGQYQRNGILRYEKVFGHTFISTGGKQTTEVHSIHLMMYFVSSTLICNSNYVHIVIARKIIFTLKLQFP